MKTALRITRCNVWNVVSQDDAGNFRALINPNQITHEQKICYSEDEEFGLAGREAKFNAVGPDTVSFDLVLDGTGAVPPATPDGKHEAVKDQIRRLRNVVYDYEGENHEPSRVRLLWGSLLFFGRLTALNITYTLFTPGGDPLRANLKLSFVGTMSRKEAARKANMSSPDLSHRVVVRQGDTLPLLCDRIYGDSAYYPEVARHNGLVQFRQLAPGTVLHFPPLEPA